MTGNAVLVIATFLTGWVALWPARKALGAWLYNLAALPVGLVGWTMAAGAAGLLGRRMSAPLVAGTAALYAGVLFWALWAWVSCRDDRSDPPALWTYFAAWGVVIATTAAATLAKITIVGYDSWAHYQLAAIFLADHGRPDPSALGVTGPLIPATIASARAFGANWLYALYPLMALNTLLLVAYGVYRLAAPRVGRGVAAGIAVAMAAVFATMRWFVTFTFYVHSQMYSALFLALAVIPLVLLAVEEEGEVAAGGTVADPVAAGREIRALATLFVVGFGTVALAFGRPDGLVYTFIPTLLVILLRLRHGWSSRRYLTYAAAFAAPLIAYYTPVFLRLGLWHSDKLSGKVALASIVMILVALAVGEVVVRWDALAWLRGGHRAFWIVLAGDTLAVLAAAAVFSHRFFPSVRNMAINLLATGGYGHVWYFIFGGLLLTLLLGVPGCGDGPLFSLFAVAQFFAIALVVFGVAHPGRLSTADSFNRVAFHIVPVALWYLGSALAVLWPFSHAEGYGE